MNKIRINNFTIGEGLPKICIPLTASNINALGAELQEVIAMQPDLIEWRGDLCEALWKEFRKSGSWDEDAEYGFIKALQFAMEIFENCDVPVIFTIRTDSEGGDISISEDDYESMLTRSMDILKGSPCVKLIDIEKNRTHVELLMEKAHSTGFYTIASYHDFYRTPEMDEIIEILKDGERKGGDIEKIAVMPNRSSDVSRLLNGAKRAAAEINHPIIAISMGELGKISRISGHLFGSTITFAAGVDPSAPGQIAASTLRKVLK